MLGNAANRSRFRKTFWWDPDVGLAAYLAEAAGIPQLMEAKAADGSLSSRPPRIVSEENPPRGPVEAEGPLAGGAARISAPPWLTPAAAREARGGPPGDPPAAGLPAGDGRGDRRPGPPRQGRRDPGGNEQFAAAAAELERASSGNVRLDQAFAEVDCAAGLSWPGFKAAGARAWLAEKAPSRRPGTTTPGSTASSTVALLGLRKEPLWRLPGASRAGADYYRAAEQVKRAKSGGETPPRSRDRSTRNFARTCRRLAAPGWC